MSHPVLSKVYISRYDYQMKVRNDLIDEYGVYCTDTRETENDVLIVVQAADLIFDYLDGEAIWYTIELGADIIAVDEPKNEEDE